MPSRDAQRLELLLEVARLLSSKLELAELLTSVLELASRVVDAETASLLLLDELFTAGDERVTDEILGATAEKKLASLAAPWMSDARPAMRRALLAYIDDGCDRPGHRPLVKALFKAFEKRADPADDDCRAAPRCPSMAMGLTAAGS